jgi:hypothetical protein
VATGLHAAVRPAARVGVPAQRPGDLIEIDTTPVEVRPGLRRIHFTTRDVVCRKDVLAVFRSDALGSR